MEKLIWIIVGIVVLFVFALILRRFLVVRSEKKCKGCVFLRAAYDLNTAKFMFSYCGFLEVNDDIYNTANPSELPCYKAVHCNAKCDNRCTKDDELCFVRHFDDQRVEEDCNNYREITPILNLNISVKEGDTRET